MFEVEWGYMNCHYVSRFLTRPWEDEKQFLHVYDFETDQITKARSKFLFSEKGLIEPRHEERISKLIESPLSLFKQKFKFEVHFEPSESESRALYLYASVQITRMKKLYQRRPNKYWDNKKGYVTLEMLLEAPEDHIKRLTTRLQSTYDLVITDLPQGSAMFFPITGLFCVPVQLQEGYFLWAEVIPLSLTRAAIFIHKQTALPCLENTRRVLMGFSISTDGVVNKCLIPPEAMKHNKQEDIKKAIKSYRIEGGTLVSQLNELNLATFNIISRGFKTQAHKRGIDITPTPKKSCTAYKDRT